MRNLASCVKVAVDFILPESLDQAYKFAEEFRLMGRDEAWDPIPGGADCLYVQPANRMHTDKLQAQLSMCLAAKHAVEVLTGRTPADAGEFIKENDKSVPVGVMTGASVPRGLPSGTEAAQRSASHHDTSAALLQACQP